MILLDKLVSTLHRLADSRKAIGMALGALGVVVAESVPFIVQWLQLFGADTEKQKRLEIACHVIAGTLAYLGRALAGDITKEDVASKTLPASHPPAPSATATANAPATMTATATDSPAAPSAVPPKTLVDRS